MLSSGTRISKRPSSAESVDQRLLLPIAPSRSASSIAAQPSGCADVISYTAIVSDCDSLGTLSWLIMFSDGGSYVGTGGTISGTGRYLKKMNPKVQVVGADPVGSILKHYKETGEMTEAHTYKIEGVGEDFIPPICDLSMCRKAYSIPDGESFATAREILRHEGLLVGSSTTVGIENPGYPDARNSFALRTPLMGLVKRFDYAGLDLTQKILRNRQYAPPQPIDSSTR